jgi:bla regulator protein BlaR1
MKPYNGDIKDIMEKSLQQHSSSLSFDSVWSGYRKKPVEKRLFSMPVTAFILLVALVATASGGYIFTRIIDKTDYPFVYDPLITGKWKAVDYVKEPEEFIPVEKSWKGDLYLNELVFIKDGKMLGSFNSAILGYTTLSWTKGLIINKQNKTASIYEIKDIDGATYMFFEWKTGDYIFNLRDPGFYVLKKSDSNDYSDFEPKRILEDDVDLPFDNDEQMIGIWQSVDFVKNIEDFDPKKQTFKFGLEELFLTEMIFDTGGALTLSMDSKKGSNPLITWTKGLVLNKHDKTSSRCEIREIEGDTFMFYEWKSGDYQYRGMKPSYYVLKKLDSAGDN